MKTERFEVIDGSKGGGGSSHTPVESPDSLQSLAKARILLALSEGEVQGIDPANLAKQVYLDGTVVENADGSRNFEDVRLEFRSGTNDQEPIAGFNAVENEIGVGVDLKASAPWTRAVTNRNIDAVNIRIGFPQLTTQEDNGDINGGDVHYQIALQTDGGAFNVVADLHATGKTTTLYERTHRIDLPRANTGWQLRVTRLTPDSTSAKVVNPTRIQAFTEIVDAKLRYPLTALLFVEYNAKSFQNVPKASIKMKGRVIRVPNNYDPIARTYSGQWNGQFKWAWSNNPAWIWYDFCLGERFGLGRKIKPEMLDKWELYDIAQRCDQRVPDGRGGTGTEPRFTLDLYVQGRAQAWQLMKDIAAVFAGMTYWGQGMLNMVSDRPAEVENVVTRASVLDGKFTYSSGDKKNRYNAYTVSYSDPLNHYADVVTADSVQELVQRYRGVNALEITALGCTSEREAKARGLWALLSNNYDRMFEFSLGFDGVNFLPGDVIGIMDDKLSRKADGTPAVYGGRMGNVVNNTQMVLDRATDGTVGDTFMVRTLGGKLEKRVIQSVSADRMTVTVSPGLAARPQPNAVWVIDAVGQMTVQLARVVSMAPDEDAATYKIAAISYNASKYDAVDNGTRIDERPISLLPPGVQVPPASVSITGHDQLWQGMTMQTASITWPAAEGAQSYDVQWRRNNSDWINVPRTTGTGIDLPGIYAGDYIARVRAVNSVGFSSVWTTSPVVTLTGKTGTPTAPLNFMGEPLIGGVHLKWAFPNGSDDLSHTEILWRSNSGTDPTEYPLFNVPYPGTGFDNMGLTPAEYRQYKARCVDKLGNVSPWTEWITANSSEDIGDYMDGIIDGFLGSDAGQNLVEKIDISGEAILQTALANHADIQQRLLVDGQNRAQVLQIQTTVSDQSQTMASLEQQVSAQRVILDEHGQEIDNVGAAVNQKMTAVVDHNGNASAQYSLKAGIQWNGGYYDAGMVLGVQMTGPGNTPKTSFGVKADQFVVVNSNTGWADAPFIIDGGATYIKTGYIRDASITNAKIGSYIQSNNYHWDENPDLRTGWSISKNGDAVFANAQVSGGIYAKWGVLDNVTINETCVIKGSLSANNIRGDIYVTRGDGWWLQKWNTGGGAYKRVTLFWVELYPDFERKLTINGICRMMNWGGSGTGSWGRMWAGSTLLIDVPANSSFNANVDASDREFVLPRGNGGVEVYMEIQSGFNDRTDFYIQMGSWVDNNGRLNNWPPSGQQSRTIGGAMKVELTKNAAGPIGDLPHNYWPIDV
ncbi:putative baseplate hub protein [Serratia phage vB_SmaM-ChibiTotoro]|nr:putative baseplate hub protein [Serratia phage vB_SmaM-ChibiTotoro]